MGRKKRRKQTKPAEGQGRRSAPEKQDHHIIPKSREGTSDASWNILQGLLAELHAALHMVFGNLKPLERLDVFLKLHRGGQFESYQKIIDEEAGDTPPELLPPDEMLLEITERIFPPDWVPGDRLMEELERRRKNEKSP